MQKQPKLPKLESKQVTLAEFDSELFKLAAKIKLKGKQIGKGQIEDDSEEDEDDQLAVRTLITKDTIMHCDYRLKQAMRKQKFQFLMKHVRTVRSKFDRECSVMRTNDVFRQYLAKHARAINEGLKRLEQEVPTMPDSGTTVPTSRVLASYLDKNNPYRVANGDLLTVVSAKRFN